MQKIADWLKTLGMSEYAQRFTESDIDIDVLSELTDQDFDRLGVSLGHRRKIMRAIREFAASPVSSVTQRPASATTDTLAAPRDTAERRQVTVMFSDLVGSTALSARMDPEDLREVISAYQKCVAETVRRFGGFVAKYLGDGVLVYFGYPQAHEDDAERAVRAGLALVIAVNALKTRAPLQTRIGIATGLVVVGDLIGAGESQERGIVGETPNLAARLQVAAKPNAVVIAESTRKLLGNLFELEALDAKNLKGIVEPVRAWAALRPSSVESRFEALHAAGLTALVGREEELELLLRRWSRAKNGKGQVVLLSGEAGIGKSRLTTALLEHLADQPHTRLRYFCSPQHTDSAFYPIIGQMERAAGITHDDALPTKLDKLDAVLAQTSTSTQDAALFAEMLSLPNDGRYPALNPDPQRRRQRTLEALNLQMEVLSRSNPVLMIVEDVHWSDPTSLEAFGRTVDRVASHRVLLIVTFRPDFEAPWIGRPYVTALTINRLAEREIGAMIDRLVGNKLLPASVRQDIIERTDGIPLFVEEMTKAVLEAEGEGEAERTVSAIPSPGLAVPPSLHASLMARLDRLGPAKEVAQIGAAIGREFSHTLLAAVVRKPEAELASALDRLIAAGLLFRQGVPPHATYLFKHALLRDAAYGCLLRSRRQALHARIGSILEEQFPDVVEQQPAILAQHWTEAGSIERAIANWTKAGEASVARSANEEAVVQLRKGLALLPALAEGAQRSRQEFELRVGLGWALFFLKGEGASEVEEEVIRARALCDQLGDRSNLGQVLFMQASQYIARAKYTAARQSAEDLLHFAVERRDTALELCALQIMGRILHCRGAFASAVACFERVVGVGATNIVSDIQSGWIAGIENGMRTVALAYLGMELAILGHLDEAISRRDEALASGRADRPYGLAIALWAACEVDLNRGAEQIAYEHLTQWMVLAREHGFSMLLAGAGLFGARLLSERGETAEGLARARQALADFAATGHTCLVTGRLWLIAYCCQRAGELDEALEQLAKGLDAAKATGERCYEAELLRLKGELLIAHRPALSHEAEACFQRALAVAREQEAKLFELHAATSLARLWRDQGKRDEARNLLAPVYGWFTEGFDTRDLKEARALLDEVAA
jgi:class 3 adenylate cyclase/tetratricopeptide (TPR) repeat protein